MKPLLYVHIGDLHLTTADEQNFRDFCSILVQLEINCTALDFVFLPGDNADHADIGSYLIAKTALKMLSIPAHIITGDHDMEKKTLNNFKQHLSDRALPYRQIIRHYNCCFLDCCGRGTGGPDFRLGTVQLDWLREALKVAESDGLISLVFMHTYPADLVEPEERLRLLELLKQ